ncbi:hypothetical protein Tco_0294174 [Tanacetum coccineum]
MCKNRQSDLVRNRIERSGKLKNRKRDVWNKNRQRVLVSKRIERSGELKNRKRVEYIKSRQSVWNGIGVNAGDSSSKTTAWNEFSSTMDSAIICLATNQKFNFSKYIFESMVKNLENVFGKFLMYHRRPKRKDTEVPQPSGPTTNVADKAVNEEMDDSLVRAATTASSLEAEQDSGNINKTRSKATPNEPSSLRTSLGGGPRRQETMGDTIAQTRSENVSKLFNDPLLTRGEKDASKQGRIADIDADEGINLVSTHFDADTDMFGVHDLVADEVVVKSEVAVKAASTIPVSVATTTTTIITDDEITLAKALAELKSAKLPTTTAATTITAVSTRPRAKGIVIHEQEQAPTPIVSLQQPSQLNVQHKAEEEEEEEERLAREKAQQIEEVNIAWDNVQARVEADYQLAQRLQAQEQEELTDEEKARLFKLSKKDQLMLDEEIAFKLQAEEEEEMLAREKAQQIKESKEEKKFQLKEQKIRGTDHQQELNKGLVEESSKKAEAEIAQESSSKRAGTELKQESIKKQKVDEDKETTEL